LLLSPLLSFALAAAPVVVDGLVIVGGGTGARSFSRIDPSDQVSRRPTPVTALCVPCTRACLGATPAADDPDGDGCPAADGDCDDRTASIGPGVVDRPDNDVDENCDGRRSRSKDRCGRGGSGPDDAWRLGELRSAVDESCPCAAFDGSRGRTHRRYRRCVRLAVKTAVGEGRLRSRCRRAAAAEANEASCGRSGTVACCEVRGTRAGRCRVRPAARCKSSARVTREDCSPVTRCADTACAASGACLSP
jgi:hypothetical protein